MRRMAEIVRNRSGRCFPIAIASAIRRASSVMKVSQPLCWLTVTGREAAPGQPYDRVPRLLPNYGITWMILMSQVFTWHVWMKTERSWGR
jgi:DNA primase